MRLPSYPSCSPMPHSVRRKLSVSFGGAMTASVRCCADDPPGTHVSECTSKPFHRGMDRSVMQVWMIVAAQAPTAAASSHPLLRPRRSSPFSAACLPGFPPSRPESACLILDGLPAGLVALFHGGRDFPWLSSRNEAYTAVATSVVALATICAIQPSGLKLFNASEERSSMRLGIVPVGRGSRNIAETKSATLGIRRGEGKVVVRSVTRRSVPGASAHILIFNAVVLVEDDEGKNRGSGGTFIDPFDDFRCTVVHTARGRVRVAYG
jgi:hypothetical protein